MLSYFLLQSHFQSESTLTFELIIQKMPMVKCTIPDQVSYQLDYPKIKTAMMLVCMFVAKAPKRHIKKTYALPISDAKRFKLNRFLNFERIDLLEVISLK